MAELDVTQMLRAAADGDAAAWRTLVSAYSRRVYGLLLRQCNDRELAEELTQVTFVKLVEKLSDFVGYEERGRFEPWLFRVAMNGLRDEMRRRKRQATPTDMSPGAGRGDDGRGYSGGGGGGGWENSSPRWNTSAAATDSDGMGSGGGGGVTSGGDPVAIASRREQIERMLRAVAELPEADRRLIEMRHTAGLSFAQIAEALGQPLGTVLARGHRALAKLRKAMDEDD